MIVPVVLAAGSGRRFGPAGDKLLTRWRGKPLLGHLLDTLEHAREAGLVESALLAAGDNEQIRAEAAQRGVRVVPVGDPAIGISASLQAAIGALETTSDSRVTGALICLGDQPLTSVDTIRALVEAAGADRVALVRPRYREAPDQPGHPVLVGRGHWDLIGELSGDRGFDPVVAARGLEWSGVPVAGSNPDIDTPEDFERLG